MPNISTIAGNMLHDSGVNLDSLQPILTNPVTGTGSSGTVPKFTGTSTLGNSLITDNGSNALYNGSILATQAWISQQGYVTGGPFVQNVLNNSGDFNLNVSGQQAFFRFSQGQWVNGPVSGNYSHVLSVNGAADNRTVQIYLGDVPGYVWWRPNQGGTWHPWERILTSNNYNSYAPTLSGGGASGTWPISISGNADTVDGYHATNAASGLAYYASNGYLYAPSWINVDNGGVFSNTNNAHLRPNSGSYGSWLVTGSRNSWRGFEFDSGNNGNVVLMINTSSNTTGFHNNSYGWQFYWESGSLYVLKNAYGGGTQALVLDSSNYNSYAPTLTGGGASGTWGISISGNAATATSATSASTASYASDTNLLDGIDSTGFYRQWTAPGGAIAPATGLNAGDAGWSAFDGYGGPVPNYPAATTQWWVGLWQGGNASRGIQLAGGYSDTELYYRKGSTSWQSWIRILNSSNYTEYAVQTTTQSNWNSYSVIGNVVGMLAWKNYGNSHVIFDASNGTSPSGGGVSQTNATYAWAASYPTLMGWNGSNTYGVRVDSARISDNTSGNSATTSQTNFTSLTVNSNTVLHAGNYNSYAPTLTGGGASGTWSINITGSAGSASSASSVPWTGVSAGTRNNYTLAFQPPADSYAGFEFTTSTGGGGGYFLIRGTSDSDVYTAEGITLVADGGWLTLAQRTQSNKGVRIMTGSTSTTRLQIDSSGNTDVGLGAGTVTLYNGGSAKFWTGSDGTRTQGWSYFQSTTQGLHWPGNNWHLHPASASDFIIRSGSNTDSALRFDTNGTTRGYVYSENDNTLGFLTNTRNWALRVYSDANIVTYGHYLTVGQNKPWSSILMHDSDEGTREIHCNSNRIGFLTQAGNWGAWLYDGADWEAASSVRAPIFYDSDNTAYYANFADTGTSINIAGSVNAATYNKPGLLLNASGTSSSGAAFGMQQVTAEGWTGIFVDYEPYTGWGLYHDNPANYFLITSEGSTGAIGGGFTVPSRSSGNRTAYVKHRFDQNNGDFIAGGNIYMTGGTLVATQSWVNSQGFATGGPFVPVSGGVNMTGSYGLNDSRLYLRTNGDTNHYLWNASDDWEELGAYAGTGFRVTSNNGANGLLYVYGSSNGGYTYSPYSFRAPIFYDSENTGYYFDGNGGTNLNYLNVNGNWGSSPFGTTHAQLTITGTYASMYQTATNGSLGYWLTHIASDGTWNLYGGRGAVNGSDWDWSIRAWPNQDGSYVEFRTSARAPIFYDSNDTTYYADFASTSNSGIRLRGGMLIGPNTGWGAYLQVGGNGHVSSSYANVVTTDGNLHLDSASSKAMYLNYYVNGVIYLNGTTYYISSNGSYYNGRSEQVTVNYNNDSNSTYQLLWGSGNSVYGTAQVYVNPSSDIIYARGGYISPGNAWGTADSAFFPNGITTAGGTNWVYGSTYIGNAPGNGSGSEISSVGSFYFRNGNTSGTWGYAGLYVDRNNAANNYVPYSFEEEYGNHSWGIVARFHIQTAGQDKPSIQFTSAGSNDRWSLGYCSGSDFQFRITQNQGYRTDNSGQDGWGTERFRIATDGTVNIPGGLLTYSYQGNGNVGGTGLASWHPSGIYCGSTMWQYGAQYKSNTGIYGILELQLNNGFIISQGGSNYGVFNSWVRLDGHYGFYSGTNNAHIYPNNGSYGSWMISGSRNGWQGIEFNSGGAGNVTLMVQTDSNTSGFHNNSYGWQIRWYNGTLYIGKNSYGGNEATVLDSSNSPYAWNMNQYVRTSDNPTFGNIYSNGWFRNNNNNQGLYNENTTQHWSSKDNGYWDASSTTSVSSIRFWTGGHISSLRGYVYANTSNEIGFLNNGGSWIFRMTSGGDSYTTGNAYIGRHIDAQNTWGNCGCTTIFVGWSTAKVMLGNGNTGAHDWANDRPSNSVVSTMNHYFYNNIYAREDVVAYWSDARLKTNVKPIENALEKINKIGGYFYTPNQLAFDLDATKDMSERVGVMAQEIEEVLPHVVKPAPFNGDYKTVQYEKLVPLLIQGIKEQQKQIDELKSKLK